MLLRWLTLFAFVAVLVPTGTGCVTKSAQRAKKAPSCPYRRDGKRRVPYKRGPMKR